MRNGSKRTFLKSSDTAQNMVVAAPCCKLFVKGFVSIAINCHRNPKLRAIPKVRQILLWKNSDCK